MQRSLHRTESLVVLVVMLFLLATSALLTAEEEQAVVGMPPALKYKNSGENKLADKDANWKVTKPDLSKPVMEADNSYCLVCHVNLETEELVDIHLPVGVGCETCHGFSDDHSADEDGLTAPEIMWPKELVNPRCMTCHLREEMLAEKTAAESHLKMFRRWEDPENAEPGEKYCLQCHGDHDIRNRTRIWDKKSGKLLKRIGGPVMDR